MTIQEAVEVYRSWRLEKWDAWNAAHRKGAKAGQMVTASTSARGAGIHGTPASQKGARAIAFKKTGRRGAPDETVTGYALGDLKYAKGAPARAAARQAQLQKNRETDAKFTKFMGKVGAAARSRDGRAYLNAMRKKRIGG